MWKFANPIKHPIPDTCWPTATESSNSLLYQPINVGPLTLTSRTWVPAMVPWRATEDGFVTQDNLDWYRRFAEGRPGALVVEATGVRDIPSGPLLRIGHDRFLPGLKQLVQTVREASQGQTKLFGRGALGFCDVHAGGAINDNENTTGQIVGSVVGEARLEPRKQQDHEQHGQSKTQEAKGRAPRYEAHFTAVEPDQENHRDEAEQK